MDVGLRGQLVPYKSPEEATAARRRAERTMGRRLPPFPIEIQMYRDAGLEPPTS